MKGHVLVRDQPWYRKDAFVSGLRAAGHSVQVQPPTQIDRDTLLLIWNRYSTNHDLARRVEAGGGLVLVAENGYLGAGGTSPKFDVHPGGPKPTDYYCLGYGFHNDSTRIPASGGPERFARLGVPLQPWRSGGEHVLVCPNRSFGVTGRAMPPDWAEKTATALRKRTARPVRVRAHPGNDAPRRPLEADLEGAWAVYVWTSSCGVHALAAGIPTFCDAPYWILKEAGATGMVDAPLCPDRIPAFERMAWGQWTVEEIGNGDAFRHLCPAAI